MAKFKAGDFVQARNGRGSVYMVNEIVTETFLGKTKEYYVFDNGAVHVDKRARSGRHEVTKADKGYKVVR